MNSKMIKGSVAGATGIVLLMGGFGTYALWSDSAPVDNAQIRSGALDIVEPLAVGTWEDTSEDRSTETWVPGQHYMVPGDEVTLTQPITIDAKGKNLRVAFEVTGVNPTVGWESLDVAMTYGGQNLASDENATTPTFLYDFPRSAGDTINGTKNLVVTFSWDKDATEETNEQNKTVSLAGMGITVTQVRPDLQPPA